MCPARYVTLDANRDPFWSTKCSTISCGMRTTGTAQPHSFVVQHMYTTMSFVKRIYLSVSRVGVHRTASCFAIVLSSVTIRLTAYCGVARCLRSSFMACTMFSSCGLEGEQAVTFGNPGSIMDYALEGCFGMDTMPE